MPIYEYRCSDCQQVFEEWLKTFDEAPRACPVCGGSADRIVSNTTFVLKGGGWYVTDYGNRPSADAHTDAVGDSTAAGDAGGSGAPAGAVGSGGSNGSGGSTGSDAVAGGAATGKTPAKCAAASQTGGCAAAPATGC